MKSNFDDIKKEIFEMIELGDILHKDLANVSDFKKPSKSDIESVLHFLANYERWYTKAMIVVKQILPNRLSDFTRLYRDDKRKVINHDSYTLSDAVQLLYLADYYSPSSAQMKLKQQCDILKSCNDFFSSKVFMIQTIVMSDVFDSEIESSKHLYKLGFLRAAGAICGVIIEKHFIIISANHDVHIGKKVPTISDYNDAMKEAAIYDVVEWRRIQHLSDIRNLCDHKKEREPTKEEVLDLINGTSRFIKNVF